MPAVDTAPILIAEKKGYFEETGIDVEIEIYTNAQNRQSALQSLQNRWCNDRLYCSSNSM